MAASLSILMVDDQPENFDVVETLLANQNYDLHYVNSGYRALESLTKIKPELILLGVMMPGIDGIQLCREIKALPEWQAVPIIMVTALSTKADLERCLNAGADDFISKPVNGVELRARVRSMLRIRLQHNQLQMYANLKADTARVLNQSLRTLRGNMTSTLTHELKTPLTGILGGLDFLRRGMQTMTREEIDEFLDISYGSACRLEVLIQKLLRYSTLECEPIQPDLTVAAQTHAIEGWAGVKANQYNRLEDLSGAVPQASLFISPEHLNWVVDELVDNAFRFSPANTPVTVVGQVEWPWFSLSISDQGPGLTPEQIDQMGAFIQFERSSMEQQGTGLGLAIAKRGTELWGGQFELDSTPGMGTTVTVRLLTEP
jgi:two-component system sensor histidine kinase/response regulator